MGTPETLPTETTGTESESESIRSFLRVSSAYLFSCAYRDRWRAAYARYAAGNPIMEHELRYRELLAPDCHRTVTQRS
jgi:hypothetical protein